ncbi:MAG: pyridoxal kinase PdxY [Pseudomonadota bacterium]
MVAAGIISIQSHVAYGHVGNCAAVFPLQRLGFEVWPVPTVIFSNHTGYGAWRGHVLEVDQIRALIDGLDERGALSKCGALLSGYLGDATLGAVVLETLERIRQHHPDAIYACDPVMGDQNRGLFVKPDIPHFFKGKAIIAADIITPNHFELNFLAGTEIKTLAEALEATAMVRALGPRIVVGTSLMLDETKPELAVIADAEEGSWIVTTPDIPIELNGTGDAFTALFLAFYLREEQAVPRALESAASAMYALVKQTHESNSRELELIAAQGELASPMYRFEARQLR